MMQVFQNFAECAAIILYLYVLFEAYLVPIFLSMVQEKGQGIKPLALAIFTSIMPCMTIFLFGFFGVCFVGALSFLIVPPLLAEYVGRDTAVLRSQLLPRLVELKVIFRVLQGLLSFPHPLMSFLEMEQCRLRLAFCIRLHRCYRDTSDDSRTFQATSKVAGRLVCHSVFGLDP